MCIVLFKDTTMQCIGSDWNLGLKYHSLKFHNYTQLYIAFCYLGDTIGAGGGCDLSVITRIRSAWGKFRELLPILTSHALSYITRGQIYSTYIRTVLLYASECWDPNVNDLLKLQRNDRAMIRWTCNVRLKDHISSDSLLRKLVINNIKTLLRYNRLCWFGHVVRNDGCINSVDVEDRRRHGKIRSTMISDTGSYQGQILQTEWSGERNSEQTQEPCDPL